MHTDHPVRLTRAQVREVDRRTIEEYGLPGVVLMENAALAVVRVAEEMLGDGSRRVLILCGGGNNGGDGLAVARHLHNRGCEVWVMLTVDPAGYRGDALIQWNVLRAMKLPAMQWNEAEAQRFGADLIIDAIFGTGLDRPPREPFAEIAAAVQKLAVPVLAVDLPSGLNCDTGQPLGACIAAKRTVTFVAEKIGFTNPAAALWLGRVSVGDIGCPREIVDAVLGRRG